ncbi:hypothetical protein BCR41DRAFT_375782 [Lobosporangium transversale]|uniref:Inositolphosphotransferase Aur1/Ipt1 domain-containing protein n=1 Tax=Lobosporangium transversale TaxID=64571 RepID=A0A1Y2G713_9FUNG|nr:hypothetical protein BCR41DRAFT_375782 [Lobosporangium transversale]ORY96025.1 hypothetical protein BCR41DRAFT_375782 [Lobosporangium transversale]|eukprot:XP_021875457.1 hypothetical protein BCR41DRAFT_375782 [Lobosporangium transversale]
MPGDPGGLARVDDILGVQMYKTTFTASPLVFGAFPSLHSADACLLAFFVVYVFGPRSIPFAMSYVFWIWWATMYLGHHYVVDLVGGGAYAVIAFWIGSFFLPSVLPTQQEEYDEYDEYDEDDGDLKYGQYYSDRKGQSSVKIDMIEALRQHEKRTLLCTPDDQDNEGDDESEAGSSSDCGSRSGCNNSASDVRFVDEGVIVAMDESLEMSRVVVDISTAGVGVGTLSTLKIKEARRVRSEGSSPSSPSSPTSMSSSSYSSSSSSSSAAASSSSRKIKKSSSNTSRQSWNGWQGYESWIEVLATVNTPRTSPKTSPVPSASSSSTNLPGVTY